MLSFDAVVIGAGPAGSTAARSLAASGATVLLLDRAPLGRDKPCGGGLTPRAYLDLDVAIDDLVLARVRWAHLRRDQRPSLVVDLGDRSVWMVKRRDFDRRLAEAAVAAGAEIRASETVTAVIPDADDAGVEVKTDQGRYHGQVVLLATGAEAPLRSALGFEPPTKKMAVALELEGPGSCDANADQFTFDYGVPDGYAWLFPKGEWWNVGILTFQKGMGHELRDRLGVFMAGCGVTFDDERLIPERAAGRRIPFWQRPRRVDRGRIALLGDAAGLADPLFGEGIAQALASGRLAATATTDVLSGRAGDLSGYSSALHTVLGQHLWRTRQAARVIYAAPSFALRGLSMVSGARRAATHVATESFRNERAGRDLTPG
jgi:geranylgeranyl reductase family protein